MARKKKVERKPVTRVPIEEIFTDREEETEDNDEVRSAEGLNLIAEMVRSQDILEAEKLSRSGSVRTHSWAEEVEDAMKMNEEKQQTPRYAKQTWEAFTKEKSLNRDQRLLFTKPLIRDGIKIAQVDLEEVQEEEKNWNIAVICKVLGANPPVLIFVGFIKRVWGHLGVVQVSKLSIGMIMVRFNDEATRDQVVEAGIVQFDRKSVIVRPWSADLNALNLHQQEKNKQQQKKEGKEKAANKPHQDWVVPKNTVSMVAAKQPGDLKEVAESSNNTFHLLQQTESRVEQQLGVCCLLETKLKNNKVSEMMVRKFTNWDYYTSTTVENRILVIWRRSFTRVIVVREDPQFLHCYVKMAGYTEAMNITFVYGFNTGEERKGIWEGIINLKVTSMPWLITGDFNSLFDLEDRKGGKEVTLNDLKDSTEWLAQSHMDRLLKTGSGYTWTNNQDGDKMIYSKIDHTFVNEEWTDNFPKTKAHYRWETISDHCLCVVSTTTNVEIGFKPFKYYNFWADHSEFKDVVIDSWQKPMRSEGMIGMYLKLMRLKHSIKRYNRERVGDIGRNYQEARDLYIKARTQAQDQPHDTTVQQKEKEAALNFNTHEKMYHSFLRQRSKGYMGTSTMPTQDLKVECMEMGNKLNREQQLALIKPFTTKEVKEALFSIPDTKSPGPNGYGVGFFKTMWPEIGAEFTKAVENFFLTGIMPRELHATMITLIPKTENPTKAVEFRPIACSTTIYKCISKLLCLRLSQVLSGLNYKRKNISPRCTIKMDISKAYDTVNWEFLEKLMKEFNLPGRFINWIMTCLKSTSYSVLMNGRVQGSFQGKKGLRQGYPLSPLLFVLIMEYLTRRLLLAADQSKFRYHPLCKNLKIINLSFADDLMIFCKGEFGSIQIIKQILDEFSATSGLTININKSHLYFGGVKEEEKQKMVKELSLQEGEFPLKYLGVPLRLTKWKAEDCGVIIKKIKQRLHTWATRHLSFAGRAQLIHYVLLGLRNYWMIIFILPHSVTKEVEKLCWGFLWGWNGNRSKLHVALASRMVSSGIELFLQNMFGPFLPKGTSFG
uniref:Reverse transcriptase domain-containing protein n=1 Tax=Cannabis sativa TaxID=3483 RepID=A0A803Q6Q9_CANSA